MVNVAVLGFGVVGSGVVELMDQNSAKIARKAGSPIKIKKILDIREFPTSSYENLFTNNPDEIFEDDSISVIVETIGGIDAAYKYTMTAFSKGKHVVTSNKELVASYGPELLATARKYNVSYLFEASVGGGIPIIRPLSQCLAANEISEITGILNGTTNYMLTLMRNEKLSFEEALKSAQQKGYAEANPSSDIEGHDSCRKIAILSSIAYDEFLDYKKIPTTGISSITLSDIEKAESSGSVIKLIASSKKTANGISANVAPAILPKTHPLAGVDDVFNAVLVKGNAIGEAMFYGRGAGKFPTASAVVADIIDIVDHMGVPRKNGTYSWQRQL